MSPEVQPIPTAVRAYAVPVKRRRRRGPRTVRPTPPQQRTLVFDTETTTDASQRLLFGSWRYFVDRRGTLPGTRCVEEGLFYADDLAELDPGAMAQLRDYVKLHAADVFPGRSRTLRLLSRTEFTERVLFRRGVLGKATVVCFNSPFDLARIATSAAPGRDREGGTKNFGGNSLTVFADDGYHPRVTTRSLDSKRSLLGLTRFKDSDGFRGDFVDCRTLDYALTGEAASLEGACQKWGVDYTKRDVTHGEVTEAYVSYCREDVGATSALFCALVAELRCHPIELEASKAFSTASVGKAYLRSIGVEPVLRRQPRFKKRFLAIAMAAFYGGRAECRIRRTPVPVVHTDFVSMYPTVNALMGSWALTTAARIDVVDATADVVELLHDPALAERLFDRAEWPRLACLVELEPNGALLPVRARYDAASPDFGIGVNPLHRDTAAYYALGDVLASVVLGGPAPHVLRAWHLVAVGRQEGLRAVGIRTGQPIDPEVDFFTEVVERRQVVKRDTELPDVERHREETVLKTIANATGYGILAEYVRTLVAEPVEVRVHRPDGTSFVNALTTPEEPGECCFPPIAACITAAARLLLALLEREVTSRGGTYAFCDTDSMAIVATCTGGNVACVTNQGTTVWALSWREVEEIVDKLARLNPYDRDLVRGSILKVEAVNFDASGARRQLWCLSIAAKRYCLFTRCGAHVELVGEPSEHGLGHYLSPLEDDGPAWIPTLWELVLRRELGLTAPEPRWLDAMVVSRVTASGPHVLQWFRGYNEGKPYQAQVKPANFVLLAHPVGLAVEERSPIAPYEPDPSRWSALAWADRHSGDVVSVTTAPDDGTHASDVVHVRTFRDVAAEFVRHPEAKSLAPDGAPCTGRTTGLLERRLVVAQPVTHLVGKEGNELDDRTSGLALGPQDYRNVYADPEIWERLIRPRLRELGRAEVAQALGVDRRTVERWLAETSRPRERTMERCGELVAHREEGEACTDRAAR